KKHPEIKVVLPQFTKEEIQKGLSDWNDLAQSRGQEEIKKQLKEQIAKQLSVEKATTNVKEIKKDLSIKKDFSLSM
ncbi:TPA: DNA primase, partial [Campylobacter fetus subsp. venerealis]|nr:DNA primase [Campylobacter fetus subsp. venerealis]